MGFIMSILSGLRGKIPLFVGLGFVMLGVSAWEIFGIDIEVAMIGGFVIGYVVGIILKRFIPDPAEKAL